MPTKILLLLLLIPLTALAAEPWLLPFPDISTDSSHVYFTGERWTAVYAPPAKGLTIRARDAIKKLPSPLRNADHVFLGGISYRAQDNTLISSVAGAGDTVRTLPDPTSDAIACLSASGGPRPNPAAVREAIGPIGAGGNRVWFGLTLGDVGRGSLDEHSTARVVGGIGWYDPITNRFGRVYSPALLDYRPQWVGVRQDSVYLLLSKPGEGKTWHSKFMAYAIRGSALVEVNLHRAGIPGDYVLNAAMWADTLLLSTNQSVVMWKPRRKAQVWESRAYQAPETQWLYLKTFPGGDASASPPVEFMPFKSNLPLEVKAKVGDWLQVVSPIAVDGYIKPEDWEKHSVLWSLHSWNCGDNLCFARVRVEIEDKLVEADFMNTAFKEQGRDRDGVKVNFHAGWAREEDLVPVMLAP
ncbi:MAG TPA: hypothetical protein VGL38_09715 [bacterium]|jgi:hypothetical protein